MALFPRLRRLFPRRRRSGRVAAAAAAVVLAGGAALAGGTGCAGYHLGPAKPAFLKNIHRIAVPTFRNETVRPYVESIVTSTVVKQFQQDGTYEIVGNQASADVVLRGVIENIDRVPARSVRGNVLLTSEFTLTVSLGYQLVDRLDGRVVDGGKVSGSTNFFVTGDITQDERQSIPLAAERAAVRLVSQLSEGF